MFIIFIYLFVCLWIRAIYFLYKDLVNLVNCYYFNMIQLRHTRLAFSSFKIAVIKKIDFVKYFQWSHLELRMEYKAFLHAGTEFSSVFGPGNA